MRRFRQMLVDARGPGGPFVRADRAALRRAGRGLGEDDVLEIPEELDAMSRERNRLPEWDGDSSDDIAFYQEDLAALLAGSRGAARRALVEDARPREALTRAYIAIALGTAA